MRFSKIFVILSVLFLPACEHVSANVTAEDETQTIVLPAAYAAQFKHDSNGGYTTPMGVHVPPPSSEAAASFNASLDYLEYLMAKRIAEQKAAEEVQVQQQASLY